jgi:hypothetical protein
VFARLLVVGAHCLQNVTPAHRARTREPPFDRRSDSARVRTRLVRVFPDAEAFELANGVLGALAVVPMDLLRELLPGGPLVLVCR